MVRQVYYAVLNGEDKPIVEGLLYETQAEPAIKEWLRAQGKAGLSLSLLADHADGSDYRQVFMTSEHLFTVVER